MEDMNGGPSSVRVYSIETGLRELGESRKVQRQALQDVTDQLRAACVVARTEGLSDAHIARAAQVSVTTLREWFGKSNNVKTDRNGI